MAGEGLDLENLTVGPKRYTGIPNDVTGAEVFLLPVSSDEQIGPDDQPTEEIPVVSAEIGILGIEKAMAADRGASIEIDLGSPELSSRGPGFDEVRANWVSYEAYLREQGLS